MQHEFSNQLFKRKIYLNVTLQNIHFSRVWLIFLDPPVVIPKNSPSALNNLNDNFKCDTIHYWRQLRFLLNLITILGANKPQIILKLVAWKNVMIAKIWQMWWFHERRFVIEECARHENVTETDESCVQFTKIISSKTVLNWT